CCLHPLARRPRYRRWTRLLPVAAAWRRSCSWPCRPDRNQPTASCGPRLLRHNARHYASLFGVPMKVAILSGSVYGTAEEVARHAEKLFKAAGLDASYLPRVSLDELIAFDPEALLTVTATTGMGELPDNLLPLYSE